MGERHGEEQKSGEKTSPEGVELVTSQIHIPGAQKTSSQKDNPLNPPKLK